jgi:hypothetical protein
VSAQTGAVGCTLSRFAGAARPFPQAGEIYECFDSAFRNYFISIPCSRINPSGTC